MSSEPPEEPTLRSEFSLLSPASPKPIHFPASTNIPVLELQMDVEFNQTEAHMNDPAMHNTEVRPDFWRDPNEEDAEDGGHVSPYSTGGEAMEMQENEDGAPQEAPDQANTGGTDSMETGTTTAADSEPVQLSNSASHQANGDLQPDAAQPTAQPNTTQQSSSDPSILLAEPDAANQNITQSQVPESAQPFESTVDVQALLNTLQTVPPAANTAPVAEGMTVATTSSPSAENQTQTPQPAAPLSPLSATAAGLGVPASGLPPRPPPQEQPLIHPNYVHSQHIRDYHPHASNPAFQPHARSGSQGNTADPNSRSFVPPVHSPSGSSATPVTGGPASVTQPTATPAFLSPSNGQSASYTASPSSATAFAPGQVPFGASYPDPSTPMESRRESKLREGEQPNAEDRPWNAEVQKKYDNFIEAERRYVSEGRWEQFPQGSRLFVGNLSSEKVTKRDIFHVFHTYGELAQISIKQAYGFVQFFRTEDCVAALEGEQGTQIRDKRIHLEVSKPQKNRNQGASRRSRSPPDYGRGKSGSNVDRYVSGGGGGGGRSNRGTRDGYRPGYNRSPSPRGYRDRYDDRYRDRSPGYGRGSRYRSPSPRRDTDDDLPLPRRAPRDVPDVQIIVVDSLERDFIAWVESAFTARSVRVDVLLLSPRLSEPAVVRRQIMEGVVAVVKLTRQNQNSAKIGLQIFDRRGGAGNVKFEEYDQLDPPIAVELVLRAKQTHNVPQQPAPPTYGGAPAGGYGYGAAQPGMPPQQYGGYAQQQQQQPMYGQPANPSYPPPSYAQTPQQQPPPPGGVPPNLQHLITNLDPSNLQSLLSAMHSGSTPQSGNPYAAAQQQTTPASASAAAALQANPALAGYLQQQVAQQQQQPPPTAPPGSGGAGGAVNMQEILKKLGGSGYQR